MGGPRIGDLGQRQIRAQNRARIVGSMGMLDYRTPRQPKAPIERGLPFARYGEWTVQVYSKRHERWLVHARRHTWSAIYEYAEGFCGGALARADEAQRSGPWEAVWIVGPDGYGYVCKEAPLA